MRSIILLFFVMFSGSFAFALEGEDSLMNDYIREGQRQYEELVKFNQQNRKEGRQQDNLYVFSLDKNEDFLTQWVAYRSMSAAEKDEYSSDFLTNLNTYLGQVNADANVKFEMYVCLVSNFKVRLKVPLDDDLNQQEKVVASLKEAYEKSKSNDDKLASENYDAYRTASRKALTGLIDQTFKNRKPNHIIVSEISYYQFGLGSGEKLVSYRRGSTFVRVVGMEKDRQDRLLADMAIKGTDFNYTMGAVSYSERGVEQKVKKIEHFLLTPDDPNEKAPESIDITALDESTKEERDAHWMRDVQALADSINQNSILNDVNNYVINLSIGKTIGLNEEISVFHHKFKVLDYETGIKFIVAFTPVDYTIPEYKKNQFAQDVLSKVDLKGNKVVLVTIPVYSFADKNNKAQAATSLGLAAAPADLTDAKFQNSVDPREFIINAYKRVPKPYTAYIYMVSVTESVAYAEKVSKTVVRGFASIYDVLIYKSKYLDQVEDLYFPDCEGGGCAFNPLYVEAVNKYYNDKFRLITEGVAQEAANPAASFRELDSDKWNTKRLKEDVVTQKHKAYFNFAIKGEVGQWFASLGTLMGFTELTTSDFYTFDQWNVIDPIVYGAIDIAGFIPLIENFSDAAGLIYASVRGNMDQVQNYTIGLAIVGAGALTVKAVKYVVALRKADNTVELVAKNASEMTAMEARDIVTYVPDNLSDLEVKGLINQIGDKVKYADNLADIAWPSPAIRQKFLDAGLLESAKTREFIKVLSRSNFSLDAADGLIRMINAISDADVQKIAAKIDGLGEDGIKFLEDVKAGLGEKMDWTKWDDKLVDAWKAVSKHADLRINPKFLENISGYSDDLLKQLDNDLLNPKWADELKALFKESPDDVTNIWKKLKEDPSEAWEISKADPAWEKWSQREFFKDVTVKGKGFERDVCLATFKNRSSAKYIELKNKVSTDIGKNLDDYDMYSQVQLKYDGDNYFVADQLFVKRDALGDIEDIIVIENKLSSTTPLTTPQTNAFRQTSFTVRSQSVPSEFGSGINLTSGKTIAFSDSKQWYKVHDGANGDVISGIVKM